MPGAPALLDGGAGDWTAWQAALDRPREPVRMPPPRPCPPVAARPRQLSATQIETLIRDPYAVYARHVLALRALDPIDADPGAADRGLFVHAALDEFLEKFPGDLPDDALAALLELGREVLAREGLAHRPGGARFLVAPVRARRGVVPGPGAGAPGRHRQDFRGDLRRMGIRRPGGAVPTDRQGRPHRPDQGRNGDDRRLQDRDAARQAGRPERRRAAARPGSGDRRGGRVRGRPGDAGLGARLLAARRRRPSG